MDEIRENLLKEVGIDKDFKSVINDKIVLNIKDFFDNLNIKEINELEIDRIILELRNKSEKNIFISMVFTYLWKKSTFENRNLIFQILDNEKYNGISCLNLEYSELAKLSKYRRSAVKKHLAKKDIIYNEKKKIEPDFSSLDNLYISLKKVSTLNKDDQINTLRSYFEKLIYNVNNFKGDKNIYLAETLLCFPHTSIINNLINIEALRSFDTFDIKNINETNRLLSYYIKEKQLLQEKEKFRTLSYLMFYINFYLPLAYKLNLTELKPINSFDEFNGSYYISTPIPLNKRLPLSFLTFVDIAAKLRSENEINFKNRILIDTREFFHEIISRKEAYNISTNFNNPILQSNIPKINRLKESTKVRLPSEVFWLFLSTTNKVLNIIETINEAILKGKITPSVLRSYIYDKELNLEYVKSKIKLDNIIKIKNENIEIKNIRKDLISFSNYVLKDGRRVDIINPMPIIQIAVALETGLRHQSIQWLSDDFDHKCPQNINENELYELFVKTDKSKNSSWYSFVSGRVITLLRKVREFKGLLNHKTFEERIPYDGHGKKWGSYKILFNFDPKNGMPYSDNLYTNRFKSILCLVDDLIPNLDYEYNIYKNKKSRDSLSCDVTPHSTRVTIVSELVNYLPPEYISKHITGHSAQTVTYYTKYSGEDIQKLKLKHKININNNNKVVELANIDTTTEDSTIVKSFNNDYGTAIQDLGCITIESKELNEMIEKKFEPKFSFESTHICPFSSICPKFVLEKGINKDCYKCPYAIRSVDHLPALCAKRREIIEVISHTEDKIIDEKTSKTNKIKLQEKRKILAEELAYYSIIVQMLDNKLNSIAQNNKFITFKPEAVRNELLKGSFPSSSDESYVLNRLEEINNFPDLESQEIKAKIKFLTTKLLVSSGNLIELMNEKYHGENSSLHTYSLIRSLMTTKNLTQEDILKIAKIDIKDLKIENNFFILENKNATK